MGLAEELAFLDAAPGALRTLLSTGSLGQAGSAFLGTGPRSSGQDVLNTFGLPAGPGAGLAAEVALDPMLLASAGALAFAKRGALARGARGAGRFLADETGALLNPIEPSNYPRPRGPTANLGPYTLTDTMGDLTPGAGPPGYLLPAGPAMQGGEQITTTPMRQHSRLLEAIRQLPDKPMTAANVQRNLLREVPELKLFNDPTDEIHGMSLGILSKHSGVNEKVFGDTFELMVNKGKTTEEARRIATRASDGLLTKEALLQQAEEAFGPLDEQVYSMDDLLAGGSEEMERMAAMMKDANPPGGKNMRLWVYRRGGDPIVPQPEGLDLERFEHINRGDVALITTTDREITLPNGKKGTALHIEQAQSDLRAAMKRTGEGYAPVLSEEMWKQVSATKPRLPEGLQAAERMSPMRFAPYQSRWWEFTRQRMLAHAAHEGYDAVTWASAGDVNKYTNLPQGAAESLYGGKSVDKVKNLLSKRYGFSGDDLSQVSEMKVRYGEKDLGFDPQQASLVSISPGVPGYDLTDGIDLREFSQEILSLDSDDWNNLLRSRSRAEVAFINDALNEYAMHNAGMDNALWQQVEKGDPHAYPLAKTFAIYGESEAIEKFREMAKDIPNEWPEEKLVEAFRHAKYQAINLLSDRIIPAALDGVDVKALQGRYGLNLTNPKIREKVIKGGMSMSVLGAALRGAMQDES